MDYQYLRTYLEVIRQRSFSKAARALGISQPAVSQQIKKLERELGVALLLRSGRGVVSLTEAGRIFLDYAERAIESYEVMRRSIDRVREGVHGMLHLVASTIPGSYLVPQLISDFLKVYPDAHVQVSITDTSDVVRKILAHEGDIGFIGASVEAPGLTLRKFATDRIVLAVYPEHPFATRESIRPEELFGQPLILREKGSGTRKTLEDLFRRQIGHLPWEPTGTHGHPPLVLGSTQAVVEAIRKGLGIGFVSARAVAYGPASARLPVVSIEGVQLQRDLYLIYEENRASSRLHEAFLAFAQDWALRFQDTADSATETVALPPHE